MSYPPPSSEGLGSSWPPADATREWGRPQAPGGGPGPGWQQPPPSAPPPTWGTAPQAAPVYPSQASAPPTMPFAPPPRPASARPSGPTRPSRAGLALALSFIGLFLCGPFAVIGAMLARRDLDAMNHGETDPKNRSKAVKAYGVGLGATILWLLMAGLWIFVISQTRASPQ